MRRWLRSTLALAAVLAVALTAGFCLRRWGVGVIRVTGTSMERTLRAGDLVLVTRWDYAAGGTPDRGDIVECRFPGRVGQYVKRVVGLPGERIAFRDGQLIVNGRSLSEPYLSSETEDYEVTLGEDEFLALGDNRADSYDSRMPDMGMLETSGLLGRARWVLWPIDRFGPIR